MNMKKKKLRSIVLRKKIDKRTWFEDIKQRNKKYAALTNPEKIVELCKDSLFNIFSGFIQPRNGTYMELDTQFNGDVSFQECLPDVESCEVCAKGSLFVSMVSMKNKVDIYHARVYSGSKIKLPEFSKAAFDAIETAFENYTGYRAVYGLNYSESTIRMIHIFAMIIQNDGNVAVALNEKKPQTLDLKSVIEKMRLTYVVSQHKEREILKMMKNYLTPKV